MRDTTVQELLLLRELLDVVAAQKKITLDPESMSVYSEVFLTGYLTGVQAGEYYSRTAFIEALIRRQKNGKDQIFKVLPGGKNSNSGD